MMQCTHIKSTTEKPAGLQPKLVDGRGRGKAATSEIQKGQHGWGTVDQAFRADHFAPWICVNAYPLHRVLKTVVLHCRHKKLCKCTIAQLQQRSVTAHSVFNRKACKFAPAFQNRVCMGPLRQEKVWGLERTQGPCRAHWKE